MNFAEVMVSSPRSVINKPLTYSSKEKLHVGQIVRVPVAKKVLNGVVVKLSKKPRFVTKPILKILDAKVTKHHITLARNIAKYYATPLSVCFALIIPKGAQTKRRETKTNQNKHGTMQMQPLTKDQKQALELLNNSPVDQTSILHGKTGTGKTRVYLELAKTARENNQGSIILIPEIGLTTQLIDEVRTVFNDVFVMHSKMTLAERHLQWMAIEKSDTPIVLGPRSALFTPVRKLGLVVIDESHDQSYKQDQTPKYNALRVARLLCNSTGSRLVLGSATPLIDDVYVARQRSIPIVTMSQLATGVEHKLTTEIIDLSLPENRGQIITAILAKQIERSLSRGLQVMLFHNRRGSSTSVLCENCGHVEVCPNCAIPLVHHHDKGQLRCHVCDFSKRVKMHCENCKQATLKFQGFGTKQVEQKVIDMFPLAKVARFDSDSPKASSLANRYKELRSANLDIMVGTQMITKGLDLPKLETVGVVNADSLMYLPDYSSSERFFQLIYQVLGRVGRHIEGKALIQTYNPENSILKAAVSKDYESFYDAEINEREQHNYPPFSFLMSLTVSRKKEETAISAAEDLAKTIINKYPKLEVLGPAPAFYSQSSRGFRWQIVIKAKDRSKLLDIANSLPSGWSFDIDPYNLLG